MEKDGPVEPIQPYTLGEEKEPAATELERYYDDTLAALNQFIENPLENDDRIKAYRIALAELLAAGHPGALEPLNIIRQYNRSVRDNPQLPKIYASNLMLRFLQMELMETEFTPGVSQYPRDYLDPDLWKLTIVEAGSRHKSMAGLVVCSPFGIQSNVADRYKSLRLALHAFGSRFGHKPRILDVGCSQNLGLKVNAGNFQFHTNTEIVGVDSAQTEALYRKLNEQAGLGPSVGVDIIKPSDKLAADWIKYCSFYPSELLDPARVAQYDRLASYEQPGLVNFMWNDFANPWADLPPDGSFDMAVLSTVMYQHDIPTRKVIFDRAYKATTAKGLIFVQDFVVVNPGRPKELDFTPWSKRDPGGQYDPFLYKTFVFDKANGNAGFQTFAEWTNGRCQTLKPGPLLLDQLDL